MAALVDGEDNVAVGNSSMFECGPNCNQNTFIGNDSGRIIDGNQNVGIGHQVLYAIGGPSFVTGNDNVAIGYHAGFDLKDGSGNVLIGNEATCASQFSTGLIGNVVIGNRAQFDHNNTVVLGSGTTSNGDGTFNLSSNIVTSSSAQDGTTQTIPTKAEAYLPIWIGATQYMIPLFLP